MSVGVVLIERFRRQHGVSVVAAVADDMHVNGELAFVACSFVFPPRWRARFGLFLESICPAGWPAPFWKPAASDPRLVENSPEWRAARIQELAQAGALIAAEIDRLVRVGPLPEPVRTEHTPAERQRLALQEIAIGRFQTADMARAKQDAIRALDAGFAELGCKPGARPDDAAPVDGVEPVLCECRAPLRVGELNHAARTVRVFCPQCGAEDYRSFEEFEGQIPR